ncbi:hypothetical protein TRIATDRAFT_88230 [Trichoderma atroviride IMI 206040]|uniref:Uncharacterized protein n=1 Tax=Hypocrea atroviridis (strain ATCC 20476 / IMI 206040) TaxID=452589 RepID=G9NV30_HYPAI|nr:uncharacterized protein TRIATDRAFT_88230 [Trichoderma atroviride IMI 206040]EHK44853.1 hypothetical protein TRIATDRAFT_88230 [Trichoderma atroviride IMI 206040]
MKLELPATSHLGADNGVLHRLSFMGEVPRTLVVLSNSVTQVLHRGDINQAALPSVSEAHLAPTINVRQTACLPMLCIEISYKRSVHQTEAQALRLSPSGLLAAIPDIRRDTLVLLAAPRHQCLASFASQWWQNLQAADKFVA